LSRKSVGPDMRFAELEKFGLARNRMSIQKAVNFTESMEQVVNSQNTATYKLQ